MPDETGHFTCKTDDCQFSSCDMFDFMDHVGVEYKWAVKLNKEYSFDLFKFFQLLSDLVHDGDIEEIYEHVQSATLLFVNASGDDFNEFIQESIVVDGMSTLMDDIEGFLKKNDN